MRIIKYYDSIHRKRIEVEVTDEVAKCVEATRMRIYRNKRKHSHVCSLDNFLSTSTDDCGITYSEFTIEEPKVVVVEEHTKELHSIIRNEVNKLQGIYRIIVYNKYFKRIKLKVIADYFGKTESSISQIRKTALVHLYLSLLTNIEFKKTYFYRQLNKELLHIYDELKPKINELKCCNVKYDPIYIKTQRIKRLIKKLSIRKIDKKTFEYLKRIHLFILQLNKFFEKNSVEWKIPRILYLPSKYACKIPKRKKYKGLIEFIKQYFLKKQL